MKKALPIIITVCLLMLSSCGVKADFTEVDEADEAGGINMEMDTELAERTGSEAEADSESYEDYIQELVELIFEDFEPLSIDTHSIKASDIPVIYDYVSDFSEGLAAVELEEKWGYIDKSGNVVFPIKLGHAMDFSEGLAAINVGGYAGYLGSGGGKWGFIDKTGNIVVPFKYDDVRSFSEGFAVVMLGGKFGFIDNTGHEIIPLIYDNAADFSEGLAPVNIGATGNWRDDGKWGFVDRKGKLVIPCTYDNVFQYHLQGGDGDRVGFRNGVAAVSTIVESQSGGYTHSKWGYINMAGKEITPFEYDYADHFENGTARVVFNTYPNSKVGHIDTTGNEVIPLGRYIQIGSFYEGLALATHGDSETGDTYKYGFIDNKGNIIIPFKYNRLGDFSEGMAAVSTGTFFDDGGYGTYEGKWGFIDKKGSVVVPLIYDYIGNFSEGLAAVCVGGEVGYHHPNIGSNGGKWGFIDKKGNVVVPLQFDDVSVFKEGMAAVRVGDKQTGKWGFITLN